MKPTDDEIKSMQERGRQIRRVLDGEEAPANGGPVPEWVKAAWEQRKAEWKKARGIT